MKLTAMTYNIQSGRNLAGEQSVDFAASVIREVQPDFVALNEVRSHTWDIGPVSQAEELGRLAGYAPVFGRAIDAEGGEYGNALLTRLPLLEQEVVHIPDPEEREEDGWYEHRAILRCVLDAGGRPITALCTHFGLMPSEQALAVETVLRLAAWERNPVLLLGDLNLEPDAPALRPLYGAFRDVGALDPSILTWPSDVPQIKIDYIFYTDALTALSVRSIDTQNSDHRPLVAELALGEIPGEEKFNS